MENQTVSSKSIMLNYGAAMGVVSIILAVAVYALGYTYEQHWSVTVLGILISVAFIALGLKAYKAGNGGELKFGQGLKTGVGIALVSTVIYTIYQIAFVTVIEPEFYNNLLVIQTQTWVDQGLTPEQIEGAEAMFKKFSNPAMTAGFTIIGGVFFGFIISLIASAIMKQSNQEISSI
ncbi:hypothetical protein KH5_23060 [Urechidicola sp. KH5]